MKQSGEVTFDLEKKEDLGEFLSKAKFKYLTRIDGGLTQIGAYINDVRPHLEIIEFILDEFEKVVGLRSQDPDLLSQFNKLVDRMVAKKTQFERTERLFQKADEEEKALRKQEEIALRNQESEVANYQQIITDNI